MIGTTMHFTRFKKIVETIFAPCASCGNNQPKRTPPAIAITIHCVSEMRRNKAIIQASGSRRNYAWHSEDQIFVPELQLIISMNGAGRGSWETFEIIACPHGAR